MYDLTTITKRYFDVKIGNINLKLLPPKLKILRRFEKLKLNEEDSVSEIIDILKSVLVNNKDGKNINADFIEDNFSTDDMIDFLMVYFNWVGEVNNNPN